MKKEAETQCKHVIDKKPSIGSIVFALVFSKLMVILTKMYYMQYIQLVKPVKGDTKTNIKK